MKPEDDPARGGHYGNVSATALSSDDILEPRTTTLANGRPRLINTTQELGMMFEPIFEPILVGFESDEYSGGTTMPRNQDLSVRREPEVLRQIVFNPCQGHCPRRACLPARARPALRLW